MHPAAHRRRASIRLNDAVRIRDAKAIRPRPNPACYGNPDSSIAMFSACRLPNAARSPQAICECVCKSSAARECTGIPDTSPAHRDQFVSKCPGVRVAPSTRMQTRTACHPRSNKTVSRQDDRARRTAFLFAHPMQRRRTCLAIYPVRRLAIRQSLVASLRYRQWCEIPAPWPGVPGAVRDSYRLRR